MLDAILNSPDFPGNDFTKNMSSFRRMVKGSGCSFDQGEESLNRLAVLFFYFFTTDINTTTDDKLRNLKTTSLMKLGIKKKNMKRQAWSLHGCSCAYLYMS